MRLRRSVALSIVLLSSTAHAELAKLGDFALTDMPKKAGFAKVTALGCAGSVRHEMGSGKVDAVEFSGGEKCTSAGLEAAIAKEYPGVKPIASTDGQAKLWEGKTTSVIMHGMYVRIVRPGPGAKRVCFADDGFAAFWKTFKDAVASNKADAVAATFKFPVKNYDDKVRFKDEKAFAKKWSKFIDAEDKKSLADGSNSPSCDVSLGKYDLSLSDSYIGLEATKVGEQWMWVEVNDQAPG